VFLSMHLGRFVIGGRKKHLNGIGKWLNIFWSFQFSIAPSKGCFILRWGYLYIILYHHLSCFYCYRQCPNLFGPISKMNIFSQSQPINRSCVHTLWDYKIIHVINGEFVGLIIIIIFWLIEKIVALYLYFLCVIVGPTQIDIYYIVYHLVDEGVG